MHFFFSRLQQLCLVVLSFALASEISTRLVYASNAAQQVYNQEQQGYFKKCFCIRFVDDSEGITREELCSDNWQFWNEEDCRTWVYFQSAWMFSFAILSCALLAFSVLYCCCVTQKSDFCFCCVDKKVAPERSRKIKIWFCISFFLVCGFLGELCYLNFELRNSSQKMIDGFQGGTNDIADLVFTGGAQVAILANASSEIGKYYPKVNEYSFVSKTVVSDSSTAVTTTREAKHKIDNVMKYVRAYFLNEYYGRPAFTYFFCGCMFLTLVVALCLMLCGKGGKSMAVVTGFFAFFSFLLQTFVIGVAVSTSAVTDDVCSVFNTTLAPAILVAAKKVDACEKGYQLEAAQKSTEAFAAVVNYTVKQIGSHSPCGDYISLCKATPSSLRSKFCGSNGDAGKTPGCSKMTMFPFTTLAVNASYIDVSPFGDAMQSLRPEGKSSVLECSKSCTNSEVRSAAFRLYLFQKVIYNSIYYISQTEVPKMYNCRALRHDLNTRIKSTMCDDFAPAIREFAIVGSCFIIMIIVTLVCLRAGVRHFDRSAAMHHHTAGSFLYGPSANPSSSLSTPNYTASLLEGRVGTLYVEDENEARKRFGTTSCSQSGSLRMSEATGWASPASKEGRLQSPQHES